MFTGEMVCPWGVAGRPQDFPFSSPRRLIGKDCRGWQAGVAQRRRWRERGRLCSERRRGWFREGKISVRGSGG